MGISIRLEGKQKEMENRFRKLGNLKFTEIGKPIAEGLRTSTMERFRTQKSPEDKKWKSSKRAETTGGITLTDTSTLKKSIRTKVSDTGIAIGTNDIRAATHQFGDDRTIRPKKGKYLKFKINGKWISATKVRVNIPKREFLGISQEDLKEMASLLDEAIEETKNG